MRPFLRSTRPPRERSQVRNALPAGAPRGSRFSARLAGSSGRGLLIDGGWRPVIALAEGQVRGSVVHIDVREEMGVGSSRPCDLAVLNTIDRERLDLAALEHALAAHESAESAGHPPVLFLPVSWSTVRSPRARRQLLHMVGHAQARLKVIPVAELMAIDGGTPPAVLRDGAAELRPIFRAVIARLTPKRATLAQLTGCDLSGASVEAGDLGETGEPGAMKRAVTALQAIGGRVMLHSLRSVAAILAARDAGAAWASLDVVRSGWHLAHAVQDALAQTPKAKGAAVTAAP